MSKHNHLPNPITVIDTPSGSHRFLIFDAPSDSNLPLYIEEFKKHKMQHLVRACDPSYSTDPLTAIGIKVHEMSFPDGGAPTDDVLKKWLTLLHETGGVGRTTIGIHCVAGLGRAPVLVAVALIEQGMEPLMAIVEIRAKRKDSFNSSQIKWLNEYKSPKGCVCIIL